MEKNLFPWIGSLPLTNTRRAQDLIARSPWLATAQTCNAIARKVAGKERADDLA